MARIRKCSGETAKKNEPCSPNSLWMVDKRHIEGVLEATRFDRAKAAQLLGISQRELGRWVTRLGIETSGLARAGQDLDGPVAQAGGKRNQDENQRARAHRRVVKGR